MSAAAVAAAAAAAAAADVDLIVNRACRYYFALAPPPTDVAKIATMTLSLRRLGLTLEDYRVSYLKSTSAVDIPGVCAPTCFCHHSEE